MKFMSQILQMALNIFYTLKIKHTYRYDKEMCFVKLDFHYMHINYIQCIRIC